MGLDNYEKSLAEKTILTTPLDAATPTVNATSPGAAEPVRTINQTHVSVDILEWSKFHDLFNKFKHLDTAFRLVSDDSENPLHRAAKELWIGIDNLVQHTPPPAQNDFVATGSAPFVETTPACCGGNCQK